MGQGSVKDMLGRSGVVSREEALRILADHYRPSEPLVEPVGISLALGRVSASDIVSPENLPEFARSTMDGFAVRSSDTFGAADSRPTLFRIIGDIPMGTIPSEVVGPGEAMRIATGGALPRGADAVVMLEYTHPVDHEQIEVAKPAGPFENVIQAGDDIRKGEQVLARGHRMRPQDMSALAGLGITCINVFQKPRVALISTGNEIIPADSPAQPGRIRDSNSYNLEGLVLQHHGLPVRIGIIRDEYDRLREAVMTSVESCDLVLMTGGSSVGAADLTAKVICDLGPPGVLVHGVSLKPGKPLIVGVVGNRGKHAPIFGLPGHPAAVSICFEVFVKPLLLQMTGEIANPALDGIACNRTVKAVLSRGVSSASGREDHIRVLLEAKEQTLFAKPVFGASGLISTLVKAVGTIVVPVDTTGFEAGDEVEVRLF